jgi:hypothetical protein
MQRIRAEPPKPPKSDYSHLKTLGVRGWFTELVRLREQALKHNPELLTDDLKIVVRKIEDNTRLFLPGAPIVQFVGPQKHDVTIPPHLFPALIVNINAPDAIIIAEFTRRLAEARKLFPPPVAKPGRHAPNSIFGRDTFTKWLREEIVRFADLLAWNSVLKSRGEPHYTELGLSQLINDQHSQRQTSEIKATLKRALASLPALAAQIKYDKDPKRKAANLREAEAMEDPADAQLAADWAKDF